LERNASGGAVLDHHDDIGVGRAIDVEVKINMNYANQKALTEKVLILGLGESGLAAARWLTRCGAVLRVADTREAPERLSQLKEVAPDAEFIGGQFTAALLGDIDFVVVSPGLSDLKELAEIVPLAKQRNIPLWSEIELFAQGLQHLRETQQYQPRVVAITGTNGKTTVTSLVGLLVARAGKKVRVAGNISPAVLDVLCSALDQNALPEVWVLELSSFQLHNTYSLQADVATVLNLAPDHLDWHGSMEAYAQDKASIFSEHTVQVLNRDDPLVMQMKKSSVDIYTFGQTAPTLSGEFGLQEENGITWLQATDDGEQETTKAKKRKDVKEVEEVTIKRLMPVDALKIKGKHNALNALAALALCRAIDLPLAPLLHGLREYQGEPHRVQFVATVHGVDYYDDSKGTNVHATVAAINGLAKPNSHLLLIAGGLGKGQDFAPLREPIRRFVSSLFLIGQAADEIATALALSENGCETELIRCATLEEAVTAAAVKARAGDIVLLSPACASFDMFKSYAHRGEVFTEAVKEIASNHGEVVI
jgi:UDP-N-acetylmuramoylalanine--D-glutamate ligase